MARPKKLSTDEMLGIVNDYYESCGDGARLKCSFLAEYAVSCGFDVKAYDFRRNADVRSRINELRDFEALSAGTGAIAYKSLDVDAFINKAKSKDALRNNLLELDETWRRIYDRAVLLSGKNETLTNDIQREKCEYEKLASECADLSVQLSSLKKSHRDVLLENRYLRKMVKTYLYPAIANEILKSENVLEQVDTEVMPSAMEWLADTAMPSPFSKLVAADQQMLSREEALLRRMKKEISEDENV